MARRTITIPAVSTAANLRLVAAAVDLLYAAEGTTPALAAIRLRIAAGDEERSAVSGGLGGAIGSGIGSTTESTALRCLASADDYAARAEREQLRDDIRTVEALARDLRNFVARIGPQRGLSARLCDGRGYEGWEVPWTPHGQESANGWADPTCRDGAGPRGLCPACLKRMNRWRARRGMDWVSDGEVQS